MKKLIFALFLGLTIFGGDVLAKSSRSTPRPSSRPSNSNSFGSSRTVKPATNKSFGSTRPTQKVTTTAPSKNDVQKAIAAKNARLAKERQSQQKVTTTRPSSTSKAGSTTKTQSATDKALAAKSKTQAKKYTSTDKAVTDFKAKNASKYTSTYATKPTTRPAHIPQSFNGHEVSYRNGRYDYYNQSSGLWSPYNPMMDMIIVSSLINASQPRVIVQQPYGHTAQGQVVHQRSGFFSFFIFLAVVLGIVVIVVIFNRTRTTEA
jgi:hypothetical protein